MRVGDTPYLALRVEGEPLPERVPTTSKTARCLTVAIVTLMLAGWGTIFVGIGTNPDRLWTPWTISGASLVGSGPAIFCCVYCFAKKYLSE